MRYLALFALNLAVFFLLPLAIVAYVARRMYRRSQARGQYRPRSWFEDFGEVTSHG